MALTAHAVEKIAELLYDFNPNLRLKADLVKGEVIATATSLQLTGPEMRTLAEITNDTTVIFDRSGANFRMKIS